LNEAQHGIRIDKWLWYARFFKSRTLSGKAVTAGHVRVNSVRMTKPSQIVRDGDSLTFAQGRAIRVVRILAIGTRRGPAADAQALYLDLSPKPATEPRLKTPGFGGKGRPTKRDRRLLDKRARF